MLPRFRSEVGRSKFPNHPLIILRRYESFVMTVRPFGPGAPVQGCPKVVAHYADLPVYLILL